MLQIGYPSCYPFINLSQTLGDYHVAKMVTLHVIHLLTFHRHWAMIKLQNGYIP